MQGQRQRLADKRTRVSQHGRHQFDQIGQARQVLAQQHHGVPAYKQIITVPGVGQPLLQRRLQGGQGQRLQQVQRLALHPHLLAAFQGGAVDELQRSFVHGGFLHRRRQRLQTGRQTTKGFDYHPAVAVIGQQRLDHALELQLLPQRRLRARCCGLPDQIG